MAATPPDIEDATNIIGLSTLVNKKHTDEKLDLEKLEKSMIGTAGIRIVKEHDPSQEFSNTIHELSKDTGLDLAVPTQSDQQADSASESDSESGSGSYSSSTAGRLQSDSESASTDTEQSLYSQPAVESPHQHHSSPGSRHQSSKHQSSKHHSSPEPENILVIVHCRNHKNNF